MPSKVLIRLGWRNERPARGQALVEGAIALPVLVMIALALVQLALYVHAENVVIGACQDGARVAATADGTLGDGIATAQALLQAGLGPSASDVTVRGSAGSDTVTLEAQGQLRMLLPWIGNPALPLHARTIVSKDRFNAGDPSR